MEMPCLSSESQTTEGKSCGSDSNNVDQTGPEPHLHLQKPENIVTDHDCVWVGNAPLGTSLSELVGFFNGALLTAGSTVPGGLEGVSDATLPVVSCQRRLKLGGRDGDPQGFGYLMWLRNPAIFHVCSRLNGIPFCNSPLLIGRPSQYADPNTPPLPDSVSTNSIVEALGLASLLREQNSSGQTGGFTSDHKVYIQDLPIDMPDSQVMDLLEQFGKLRVLNIIRDPITGISKGYGFFEFEDTGITDFAIQALNGFVCGRNILKVQRSTMISASTTQTTASSGLRAMVTSLPTSMTRQILEDPILEVHVRGGRRAGLKPSNVVQLLNAVVLEDLVDDEEYLSLMNDLRSEAARYGPVKEIVVPRPNEDLTYREGVGKVFLHYGDLTAARKAQLMLNGRKFDNKRVVCAAFFPLERFMEKKYTI